MMGMPNQASIERGEWTKEKFVYYGLKPSWPAFRVVMLRQSRRKAEEA